MYQVLWMTFDQDGLATLIAGLLAFVVGLAAVAGAVIVGLRQTVIQTKQTEIQNRQADVADRQVRLEELKLRAELFDDRFEVYEVTREWLDHVIRYASPPGYRRVDVAPSEEAVELRRSFNYAIDRSRFLFAPDTHRHLRKIWKDGLALAYHQQKLEGSIKRRARQTS